MSRPSTQTRLLPLFLKGVFLTLVICAVIGTVAHALDGGTDTGNNSPTVTQTSKTNTSPPTPLNKKTTTGNDLNTPPSNTSDIHADDQGTISIDPDAASAETPFYLRLISAGGIFILLGIAWLLSTNRKAINWRLVAIGIGIQIGFGILILQTSFGETIFSVAGAFFTKTLSFTAEGSKLLFGSTENNGEIMPSLQNFAFDVLPTIIFFSSLMSILYHLQIMQKVVGVFATAMRKTMGTSGAETLSAAANIFVGQTEAPLMIKPYINKMTMSELMAVMTGGFATVAGGVMASYISFLHDAVPTIAQHLVAASVMSAPAALVIAKIMYPEEDTPETIDGAVQQNESPYDNTIDAAAGGAAEGLKLALNVGAMLLAFVALVAMANYIVAYPSYLQQKWVLANLIEAIQSAGTAIPESLAHCNIQQVAVDGPARMACIDKLTPLAPPGTSFTVMPTITLERILGWLFYPFALISGVPFKDVVHLGELYGQKTILNEFYAYLQLMMKINDPAIELSKRTIVIASYGLCGFANLSSIAIQIGGIGGIAPDRRSDLAKIGLRAMVGGTLAAWITGNVVGVFM